MKSIIQKSLYTLFLASYIFSASCFANEKETPKENNETTSSSLKKEKEKSEQKSEQKIDESKKESDQKIDKKYVLLLLLSVAIITVYMLSTSQRQAIDYNDEHVKEIKALLDNGTGVNELDENGKTLLYTQLVGGNKEAIRYLLEEKGANVNLPVNGEGSGTVLHLACYAFQKDIIKILLKNKADVTLKDKQKRTPLDVLLDNIGKEDIKDIVEIIQLLVQKGVDINAQDSNDETTLYRACKNCIRGYVPLEIVDELRKHGANINVTDKKGNTLLHFLCQDLDEDKIEDAVKIIQFLVEHGVDINAKNDDSKTAMDLASDRSYTQLVTKLKEIDKSN